ncbi:hypothetical protein AALP_AA6G147500 [Arabis alpina]|uniref:Uncharacterized protein n=1 Tax=Arabis alpina TaxID=50452 RepID=A0A087GP96_ARAAL|nr:hypothetical protein AALP_AA6G147500 [Arabis alpina]
MFPSRDSFMNALRMNGGDGELSYASNSRSQRSIISKTLPVVEETIEAMLLTLNFPKCIKVADLGCSSGENTLLVMSQIVNTIIRSYQQKSQNSPEIDYCLNDLPENDFNATFKSFNKDVKGKCFVSGTPGSFYSRLFPKKSLHFFYSSSSIHWLSKVPQGLENNKNNVYIRSGCSLDVCKSYMNHFQNDFSLFLRMRSEEMLPSGRMVLAFMGKTDLDPLFRQGYYLWSLLSDALVHLVSEGIVKQAEVDSFNVPYYLPNEGEVREIVENEGSFEINKIETFEIYLSYNNYDEDDDYNEQSHRVEVGRKIANVIRAVSEPMLVTHFGDVIIINRIFDKLAYNASQDYVGLLREPIFNFIVSLTRK